MSGRARFKTVSARQHHLGRIAVLFNVDKPGKQCFVNLLAARELEQLLNGGFETRFHVRVQILPQAMSATALQNTLFPHQAPISTKYIRESQTHMACPNPQLEEEFMFDLADVWRNLGAFRLHIAVMSEGLIATDDTGFGGCLSFPLNAVVEDGPRLPRWYWLLSKKEGVQMCIPVEHEIVSEAVEPVQDVHDVFVSGRRAEYPNSFINGVYAVQREVFNGRLTFKQQHRGLYLFFHSGRGAWVIADALGHPAPYAFVDDDAYFPGDIENIWLVFNKEREYTTKRRKFSIRLRKPQEAGNFEHDLNMVCRAWGVPEPEEIPQDPEPQFQSMYEALKENPHLLQPPPLPELPLESEPEPQAKPQAKDEPEQQVERDESELLLEVQEVTLFKADPTLPAYTPCNIEDNEGDAVADADEAEGSGAAAFPRYEPSPVDDEDEEGASNGTLLPGQLPRYETSPSDDVQEDVEA
eukprot:m.50921 g.50921  ORF g.50921 m.50921 type:complete len:468 (-) comp11196_c0_seq1:93-1496(-)